MMALPNVMAKAQTSDGSLTLSVFFGGLPLSSISAEGQVLFGSVLEICSLEETLSSDAKWILHMHV